VLQCVYCIASQCVAKCFAECCSVLLFEAVCVCDWHVVQFSPVHQQVFYFMLRVVLCYSVVLQCCVAVCCSVSLQCVALCCSVLHCVAVCCSVKLHACATGMHYTSPSSPTGVVIQVMSSVVLHCFVAVSCCSVALQCVSVLCCSVLQCVAVCCISGYEQCCVECVCSVLQCVAMCCNVLLCFAMCCSVLQLKLRALLQLRAKGLECRVAECCSVMLHYVALFGSVLQCVLLRAEG